MRKKARTTHRVGDQNCDPLDGKMISRLGSEVNTPEHGHPSHLWCALRIIGGHFADASQSPLLQAHQSQLKFLTGVAKLRRSVFSLYRQQGLSVGNQFGRCLIL
jgi:hypothetical protein